MENKSIKILIIEDNPADIRLIREMLIEAGNSFHMEPADSLSKGLQQITDTAPDVVLLDLSLPDSQGLDTFHKLYAQISGLPVIILTGLDDESLAIKAVQDGAQDYLVKGQVDGDLLKRSIRYAIERKRVEEKINLQNEYLKNILESLSHPFYIIDPGDYTIKLANSAALPNGITENITCHSLTHHQDHPCNSDEHICPLKIIKETKKPVTAEHIHYYPDGKPRYVEVHGHPIIDREGNVSQIIEYSLDITERKESERQIARKNNVLNAINRVFEEALKCNDKEELGKTCLAVAEELTGSSFGFFDVLNQNGQFITLAITHPEGDICRMSSSGNGERSGSVSVHSADRSTIRHGKSIIINGEDAISAHSDYINIPKGHPKLTSFLGVPLRGNGIIIGMIALANKKGGYNTEDQENIEALSVAIAEAFQSKLDEEKYRIISERLSLATMAANIGIWDWDVRSNKLNWDNQMCLQHGAMYREFTGTFEEWSASLHPDDRARTLNEMQWSLNEQRELRTEFRILCPDSSERNIYTAVRVFKDKTGKTSRMIGVHLDITEQKAAEAELKKHKESLQEMVEERTLELQKEIRERIKAQEELQHKMDQMERFTRLAVGRETQMIRLKEEVNSLMIKLGEPDKYKIVQ